MGHEPSQHVTCHCADVQDPGSARCSATCPRVARRARRTLSVTVRRRDSDCYKGPMDSTDAAEDELRQARLSKFGRVLALVSLGYVGLVAFTAIYVNRLTQMRASSPFVA